jgi:hypothetical protein
MSILTLRTSFFGLLFLVFTCLPFAAKADTFDFSFSTLSGDYSGSGVFGTLPYATDYNGNPVAYSGFYISSLDGEVNGIPMVLAPGTTPGSTMDYYGPLPPIPDVPLTLFTEYNFLNGALNFTLDGQGYFIHDIDCNCPHPGLNLYEPTGTEQITMTVIPAPEPATRLSLLLGLLLVAGLAFKDRGSRFLASLRAEM